MLPEAAEGLHEKLPAYGEFPVASVLCLVGIFLIIFVEKLLTDDHGGHGHSHAHGGGPRRRLAVA